MNFLGDGDAALGTFASLLENARNASFRLGCVSMLLAAGRDEIAYEQLVIAADVGDFSERDAQLFRELKSAFAVT